MFQQLFNTFYFSFLTSIIITVIISYNWSLFTNCGYFILTTIYLVRLFYTTKTLLQKAMQEIAQVSNILKDLQSIS